MYKEFDDFDPKIFKEIVKEKKGFTCVITSKRGTGKSILLRDVCSKLTDTFDTCYVFSLTAHLQPTLFDFCDKQNIIGSFDEEKLTKIYESQEKMTQENEKILGLGGKPVFRKVLILMDDLISDKKVKHSKILDQLYVAGRHVHISTFFLTQHFTAIPPVHRNNLDVAVSFYQENYDNRVQFVDSYLSVGKRKEGVEIFDLITKQKYQALIVCNFKINNNIYDYINKYTANPKVKNFKIDKKLTKKSIIKSTGELQFLGSGKTIGGTNKVKKIIF